MNATMLDDRRRLVMPRELPAHSAVIIHQLDEDNFLVVRAKKTLAKMVVLLPDVKRLPSDAAWQETESRIVAHNSKPVAPFEG